MSEIDHEFTDFIVCPHCGEEYTDLVDWGTSGSHRCDECGNEFIYEATYTVTYCTRCVNHTWGEAFHAVGDMWARCSVCGKVFPAQQ